MENFILTDLQTQDRIILNYSFPSLILFISLNDIILLKDINKDIQNSDLYLFCIYIGNEAKKVHLWKTREKSAIAIYHGGAELKQ